MPHPTPDIVPVAEAVEEAVSALQRWLTRPDVRRAMTSDAHTLSPTDNWLLGHLHRRSTSRMSDLASWQGVDRSTITAQIRKLEARGLVSRTADPADGRAVLVSLTDAGGHARDRQREVALALFQQLLSSWTPTELESFEHLLTKFVGGLDTATQQPS